MRLVIPRKAARRPPMDSRWTSRSFLLSVVGFVLLCECGCEPPPRPPLVKKKVQNDRLMQLPQEDGFEEVTTSDGQLPLRFAEEVPFELWEAYFFNGEQIGYAHLQAESTDSIDEVRYRYTERMQLLQGDQMIDSELSQTSIENRYGRVKRFDAVLLTGSQKVVTSGVVAGDKLDITVKTNDAEEVKRQVTWKPYYGGLLAVQQHLREKPMKRGDKRELNMLAPIIYESVTIKLEGIGMASVMTLSGENKTLLEIELTDAEGLTMTLWTDEKGNILSQNIPRHKLRIFRTDRETATEPFSVGNSQSADLTIPLNRQIENPGTLIKSSFVVSSKNGRSLANTLKDQPGQFARQAESGQMQIAVVRERQTDAPSLAPVDEDLLPGPLVQSNDALVKAIAAVTSSDDKRELAWKLSRTVYDHIKQKDNSENFASAAIVAGTGRGDSTEHSVLLAALCRAKGIPSRVAAGLVYHESPDGPALRYHMWTLAYVDEDWLHLDATSPDRVVAADRIVVATDNLASGSEYAVVQDVLTQLDDLQVEVGKTIQGLSVEPKPAEELEEKNPEAAPAKSNNPADALEELLKGIDTGGGSGGN